MPSYVPLTEPTPTSTVIAYASGPVGSSRRAPGSAAASAPGSCSAAHTSSRGA